MASRTALVTGGSGYIALHVVYALLESGWTVHATVRSLHNTRKVQPLRALGEKHPGKLQLFEADLLVADSFLDATQGCFVVFHIASPFLVPEKARDPQKELVDPAVKGTRNVLECVNKTNSVKRVVLTSSVGAIYGDNADVRLMENQTLQEQYFNKSSTINHNPYQYAKTKAEREAWKIVEAQSRWQLVVICPGLVLGPSFTSVSDSGSLSVIDQLLSGQMLLGVPDLAFVIVDVRDVAAAHVRAAELPQANGRYIISNSQMTTYLDMSRCLKGVQEKSWALPGWQMPDLLFRIFAPLAGLSQRWIDLNLGIRFAVDNERSIQELGMKYRPVKETLTDHYHSWVSQQKESREHGDNVVKALG